MRNISFTFTIPQVKAQTKTVTRRQGWSDLKAGDLLCAIEKGRGLAKGEKVRKLGTIRVLNVRPECLARLLDEPTYGKREVILEGFPDLTPAEFVQRYCKSHRGSKPLSTVTRIEFKYEPLLPEVANSRIVGNVRSTF